MASFALQNGPYWRAKEAILRGNMGGFIIKSVVFRLILRAALIFFCKFACMIRKVIILLIAITMSANCHAQYERYHGDGIDDVLQYVPMASSFALKLVGVEGQSSWKRRLVNSATSFIINAGVVYTLKHTIHSTRPDGTDNHSFPSGHTATAFCGATTLHKEYGKVSPWISVAGYTVATITAIDRVRRNRHHWGDVLAGAAIGVLSAEAGCRIGDLITKEKDKNVDVAVSPCGFLIVWRL